MKRIVLSLVIFCGVLSACTSIEQPVATVDLVQSSSSLAFVAVADDLNRVLNGSTGNASSTFNGQSITLQPVFFSATGKQCRYLVMQRQQSLYCKAVQGDQWTQIRPVLSNAGVIVDEVSL